MHGGLFVSYKLDESNHILSCLFICVVPDQTLQTALVADLFLFCYERVLMLPLSEDNQSGVIEAFNSTSRYVDDLLNIDNNFFGSMFNRIYPSELQ